MPKIRTGVDDPEPVRDLAHAAGLLTLPDLADLGVTRGRRRAQVRARRWDEIPYRAVLPRGETGRTRDRRAALVRVGSGARLGGVTALEEAGLTGFVEPHAHVWVPKSLSKEHVEGVVLHETRRWTSEHAIDVGLPRSQPHVAAVQGALWAVSVRQAVLVVAMTVQQRIARAEDIAEDLARVRRHRFRRPLQAAMRDITDGATSLNELDFAAICRAHGLPEPDRQVLRRSSQGRIYLDARFRAYGVSVEVNGAGHLRLDQLMKDEIRAIDLQTGGDAAVEISVLTLRCDPGPWMAALRRLLVARGWRP